MNRLDYLAMNILKGLMSRYGEAGYSDGAAIDEAYRLALNIIDSPIKTSNSSLTICPCCGETWNIEKYNTCQCGAYLGEDKGT